MDYSRVKVYIYFPIAFFYILTYSTSFDVHW